MIFFKRATLMKHIFFKSEGLREHAVISLFVVNTFTGTKTVKRVYKHPGSVSPLPLDARKPVDRDEGTTNGNWLELPSPQTIGERHSFSCQDVCFPLAKV